MEQNVEVLFNEFLNYNLTTIRNKESSTDEILKSLVLLGGEIGKYILSNYCLESINIETPMNATTKGLKLSNKINVVVSTRNDYSNFGLGCRELLENSLQGQIDFGVARGREVYKSEINAISLPQIPLGKTIHNLIILKSILATGCTAIALTRRSLELYRPKNLIIGSIFYSTSGISDICTEFPNAKVIVIGKPDELDSDGMLIPGIGNLEDRIKNQS